MNPGRDTRQSARAPALGFIDVGFSFSFTIRKLVLTLAATTIPLGLCMMAGQGLAGLLIMVVGLWPYRCRFLVDARGLGVSWFFLKEWLSWDEIRGAQVIADPRRYVIGAREPVLLLQRDARKPVTLRGDRQTLERLATEIWAELENR